MGDDARLTIGLSAPPGALASDPARVLRAVFAAALADGAGPEWVDALIKAAGGTTQAIGVSGEPRFQVQKDAQAEQSRLYGIAMEAAILEITEVLEDAARRAEPPTGG